MGKTRRVRGLPARLRATALRIGELLGVEDRAVTLLLTDDAGIRRLNAQFRGKDAPTDVLSFPSGEGEGTLGDLAMSLDRAAEQAAEQGHGVMDEAEVLLLHGVLHLLGHDHETDRGQMRRLEGRLALDLFGTTRGLIDRTMGADTR